MCRTSGWSKVCGTSGWSSIWTKIGARSWASRWILSLVGIIIRKSRIYGTGVLAIAASCPAGHFDTLSVEILAADQKLW